MKAHEVMSREVRTCGPESDLQALAATMWDGDCGAVPVVQPEGRLVGLVTDRDIAIHAALQHKPLWELKARELFKERPVITCREEDEIDLVLEAMSAHHVRRVPVVDGAGRLTGIISIDDLLVRAERTGDPAPARVLESLTGIVEEPVRRHQGELPKRPGAVAAVYGGAASAAGSVPGMAMQVVSGAGTVVKTGAYVTVGIAAWTIGLVGAAVGSVTSRLRH